jgi:hypothetical protein
MGIIIRHLDGRLEQAFLMSVRGNVLRVLRPGCDDTAEFTVQERVLLSEANKPVEIEFMDLSSMLEELPRTDEPQMTWVATPRTMRDTETRTLPN